MKRFIAFIGIFLVVSCTATKPTTTGQTLDRTNPPPAGPAPEIQLGDYQTFTLDNGMKVYVVENNKLPRVAFSLRIDRDPILEGEKAGFVSVCGDLLSRGTTTKTKAEIDESIDFIGASLSTSSTGLYGSSLVKHKDKVLEVMQDILYHPTFPQEELDKLIKLNLSSLESNKDEPSAIVINIRNLVVYGKDHPYGEMLSEESLKSITRQDCVDYFAKFWNPQDAYLAIIGDITVKEARELATEYFGAWKGEKAPGMDYAKPAPPKETTVVLVDRPQSVQSEIRIAYPVAYNVGDPDYFSAKLLNMILGGGFSSRLMQNLREDKAYTYGAGSGFSDDDVIGRFSAGASVRNEVTDSAVHEFLYEMELIANEGVTEEELKAAKAYLTGSFARSLESPQTIAGFAITTAWNNLPEDYYQNYLKQLDAVTVEEVNAAAKKFILPENAYIVVVGKAEEVGEKLKKFGPVQYYNVEGKRYDPGEMNKALEGMSATNIIDDYLAAIGGAEQLKKIGSQAQTWELSAGGMTMEIASVKTRDGRFRTDVKMGGSVQQSLISDGKNVVTRAGSNEMPMDEASRESELINNRLFPELYYADAGVTLKLAGIEKVDGAEAYHISVIYPSGKQSEVWFDAKSHLKVKETTTIDTPQGSFTQSVTYGDYRKTGGILYPHSSGIQMGPQKVESKMISIENDVEIGADTFAIE